MSIYLDHAATTPLLPQARRAMAEVWDDNFGNPSSIHRYGRKARARLDEARQVVSEMIGARPHEVIFTSGGTEADNLALVGVAMANRQRGQHIVVSAVEHHAVLATCRYLEQLGFRVTYLPVDDSGRVDVEGVRQSLCLDTILVSILYGNNEVGTIQPVLEVGALAREHGVFFHSDAVQAFAVEKLDVGRLPFDLLTLSSHKIGGPKGAGALYAGQEVPLSPLLHGGSQEGNRRAGTENVTGIVGFAEAVKVLKRDREQRCLDFLRCRERMLHIFGESFGEGGIVLNGHAQFFLPQILNVSFPGVKTETLLMRLDLEGVAASSGSACSSGSLESSHVLKAMKLEEPVMESAVRFSFGWSSTLDEVEEAALRTVRVVQQLRALSGRQK